MVTATLAAAAKARPTPGAPLFGGRVASQTQSLVDRAYRNPGDLHGGAGYLHRQRRLAAYGGDSGRQPGRSHLGADQLPGFERHRAAHLRLALHPFRTQALLHDLRGAVYHLLAALRPGAYPAVPDSGPHSARPGRRRTGSQRTGHPGGYVSRWNKGDRHLPSTAWPWWPHPPSDRRWAAGSPTTSTGTGSSSSTCPSASSPCCSATGWWKIRPTWLKDRAKANPIDKMGLGLVAVGVGCLEFVLDKGQEKDWFGDRTITLTFLLAITTLAIFVWWEWGHPDPIVDLKLLKNRNFGTAVGFQFILGMVLFSTTVLIPQFLQGLMGYTAERAGMALSAGALVLMVMMPVAGKLVSHHGRSADGCDGLPCDLAGPLQHDPAGPERELRAHRDVARLSGAGVVVHLYPHQHPELCGRAQGQEQPDLKLLQLRPQLRRQHGHGAPDHLSRPHPADPPVSRWRQTSSPAASATRTFSPRPGAL